MSLYVLSDSSSPSSMHGGFVDTSPERLDGVLAGLAEHAAAWAAMPPPRRAGLLRECVDGVLAVSDRWIEAACAAKRVTRHSATAGEEWIGGPMITVRYLRLLAETLERPNGRAPSSVASVPGGRTAARVFPLTTYEQLLYPGIVADIWTLPGRGAERGDVLRRPGPPGVAAVLGAGNVASIAPTDALYSMIFHNRVVALKMNPVNEYLGPLFREALAPLVEPGFLELIYGGAAVGRSLCEDPRIDSIHLTGSRSTYDAIVWGDVDADERREANRPAVSVPVTAELGCVTPVLVVPGRWSAQALQYHARNIAAMVAHNASFNCTAAKVVVLPRSWYLRDAFLEALKRALAEMPPRTAYYPGAQSRYAAFCERYPDAQPVGASIEGGVPWTLLPDVPARAGEFALSTEAFCGVLATVELDAGRTDDPAAFLARAVPFVNDEIEGTLSCVMLLPPDAERRLGAGLDQAIAALRYGGIGINVWSGILFGLGTPTWGAFPGHEPRAIGSGVGVVHNALMLDHPERSVARAPFDATFVTPPWFPDHRNLAAVGRKITTFEADPSVTALPGLTLSALFG